MMRIDQKTFFTALAFLAVVQKGKDAGENETAEQIRQLANLIEAFCADNVVSILAVRSEDTDAAAIDLAIERHIQELQQKQETRLPEDRETLIKFYDRLYQRKARRVQRDFYANATEAKLADLVLRYLDEEIDDDGGLT
jgi:hypothetical protein